MSGKVRMHSSFFAGKVEGQPFVAAQTFIASEQDKAGLLVDSMTTRNGTHMPEFNNGWLLRAVDPKMPTQRVVDTLEHTGARVIEVGEVPREEIARFVGPAVVEQVFGH